MGMRIAILLTLVLLGMGITGCRGSSSKRAHQEAQKIASDQRRMVRVPDGASRETVRTAMDRKPDAVQYDKDMEIHYYFVEGATEGETIRFVFRNDRLIGRNVVKVRKP